MRPGGLRGPAGRGAARGRPARDRPVAPLRRPGPAARRTAQVQDVQHLLAPDASYDVVVAAWMLYHVPDLDRGLAEVRRVLRPGGTFIAVTNGDEHVAALRREAGGAAMRTTFSRENGEESLLRHFDSVVRARPRDPGALRGPRGRAGLPGVLGRGHPLVTPGGKLAPRLRRLPDGLHRQLSTPHGMGAEGAKRPGFARGARGPAIGSAATMDREAPGSGASSPSWVPGRSSRG